jgi:hypothetical protein
MDQFWKWATYLLLIFALIAVLMHAAQFSSGTMSLAGFLSSLGKTIMTAGTTA